MGGECSHHCATLAPPLLIFNFFLGLGPGGLKKFDTYFWASQCIPGSSHGGIALPETPGKALYSGPAYDQDNKVSLLGGSGGEINYQTTFMN